MRHIAPSHLTWSALVGAALTCVLVSAVGCGDNVASSVPSGVIELSDIWINGYYEYYPQGSPPQYTACYAFARRGSPSGDVIDEGIGITCNGQPLGSAGFGGYYTGEVTGIVCGSELTVVVSNGLASTSASVWVPDAPSGIHLPAGVWDVSDPAACHEVTWSCPGTHADTTLVFAGGIDGGGWTMCYGGALVAGDASSTVICNDQFSWSPGASADDVVAVRGRVLRENSVEFADLAGSVFVARAGSWQDWGIALLEAR